MSIKEKMHKAAIKYLELSGREAVESHQFYDEEDSNFITYIEDDLLHICVVASHWDLESIPTFVADGLIDSLFNEDIDESFYDKRIVFDVIGFKILNNNRAIIKHGININVNDGFRFDDDEEDN